MSSALSDYNKTKSSRLSRRNSYSDLDLNFRLHPNTSDIKPLTDLDAVKNSVTNLLLTNFGVYLGPLGPVPVGLREQLPTQLG